MSVKDRLPRIAAAMVLAAGFVTHRTDAATLTVGNDTNCQYGNVQSAVDALTAGGTHEIRIKSNLYEGQAVRIDNRSVRLVGGYANCSAAAPTGVSTLSGVGGGHDSVVTITGNSNDVILENLSIIKGDEVSDGVGGGVDFRGGGTLRVRASSISNNYAGYGGGISFTGTAATRAQLRLEAGTLILNNVAQYSGGGIRVEGNARLQITDDNVLISGNEAKGVNPATNTPTYGYGGGILVLMPADADIGSPGLGNGGLITENTARYGGGIAMSSELDVFSGVVRLFTTDASRPLRIRGNRATNTGGGLYLRGPNLLRGFDFRIDGNRAQEGSAIYADTADTPGVANVALNGGLERNITRPTDLGAVPCSAAVACNLIDGNIAETVAGQATTGAAVLTQTQGIVEINRTTFSKNRGGQVARNFGFTVLLNALIADNVVTGYLLRQESNGATWDLHVENSTIAGNSIGAAHVISASGDIVLSRSISWQPGRNTLIQPDGSKRVGNVLANETISIGGPTGTIVNGDPLFVDAARGDYRPHAASPAVDFASSGGGPDLAGNTRGFDLPIRPNWQGTGDLGAYERVDVAPLVRNGQFDGDLRLWSTDAHATWDAINHVGPGGSGSLRIGGTLATDEQAVATQCVRVPGPGLYRLEGWGRSVPFSVFAGDRVSIGWSYAASDGAGDCSSVPIAFGERLVTTTENWTAVEPMLIDATSWTRSAYVLIRLIVQNRTLASRSARGYFDGITLAPAGDDTIFRNGFDG
ncbi:hypothetical protein [Dokdonella sp.]|uniref:hypothetical protein n=1 Tax=Dokdonella sp. TaxID=2291710 RepID=UPI001B1BBE28|nr:hypothetical protein [Dokdonella sp.]MBO9664178.1 hypothetical protein [Dokdonella sp.]